MPGFIGVGAGKIVPMQAEADVEVYLLYTGSNFFKGTGPPGAIEAIPTGSPELDPGFSYGWSFGEAGAIKVSGDSGLGDPHPPATVHRSADAGATWTTPIQTAHIVTVARDGDDMYALDTEVFRTVDSGTIWNQVTTHSGSDEILNLGVGHVNLYFEVDNSPWPAVKIAPLEGGDYSDLIDQGRLIGQVDTGYIIVDQTLTGEPVQNVVGPWPVMRYVGGSASATDLPDEYFVFDEDEGIVETFSCAGVACHGSTAVLLARNKTGAESPLEQVIYRSENRGSTFTEVLRTPMDPTSEKFGKMEVGYASRKDGVWWVGGASQDGNLGLWRSADDGVTWIFVQNPDTAPIVLDNAPKIISSGRPAGASR